MAKMARSNPVKGESQKSAKKRAPEPATGKSRVSKPRAKNPRGEPRRQLKSRLKPFRIYPPCLPKLISFKKKSDSELIVYWLTARADQHGFGSNQSYYE